MILVKVFYLNALRECCYIVSDETGECLIIDPGISTQSERDRIVKYISNQNLRPVKTINTHGHFDHVMGDAFITETYNIPTYLHKEDIGLLSQAVELSGLYGYIVKAPCGEILQLTPEQPVTFGTSAFRIIHTPGHTHGSVILYSEKERICFTGDTLFRGNCGRVDLPEGDVAKMRDSLLNKIVKQIPPDTQIYPGHGEQTTMAEELNGNPYLRASSWF